MKLSLEEMQESGRAYLEQENAEYSRHLEDQDDNPYLRFTVEERGKGNLCAVFDRKYQSSFPFNRWHDAFNEESLVRRVARLEASEKPSTMSRCALEALRARKAEISPT
jgi:hypothetical protein